MKHHGSEGKHGEDNQLDELKGKIEQRLRRHGEGLRRQVAAGEISQEEAQRELVKLQNANNMAHIESAVREGDMTRAEADALYKKLGIK